MVYPTPLIPYLFICASDTWLHTGGVHIRLCTGAAPVHEDDKLLRTGGMRLHCAYGPVQCNFSSVPIQLLKYTGRERLIPSHSSARLSGNSN